MIVADIIVKKRDGRELDSEEITGSIRGFMEGAVSEGQMGALLMAIYLRGMTARETSNLAMAMLHSGDVLDLSSIPGLKVDKHSTGGVGDKTTLVVAPLVAALGVPVAKMSGRALGHTGGTIDKLECIPGLTTQLSPDRFCRQVAEIGVAVASQSPRLAPADGRLYALRDATGTVESLSLIAASVMSKKLAVGADALVLDVKAGGGAFLADIAQARELAQVMVHIGRAAGKRVVALVTDMEQPLGEGVGEVLELCEAVAALSGGGPADLGELCEVIAGHMLFLGGKAPDPDSGRAQAAAARRAGVGLAKLKEMAAAQGGDASVLDAPERLLLGTASAEVRLAATGYVTAIDARQIGFAIRDLKAAAGAGAHQCGVRLHRKVGDVVDSEPVATVLAPAGCGAALSVAGRAVAESFGVGKTRLALSPLVREIVE